MNSWRKKLGDQLKQFRTKNNLKQSDIVSATGISRQVISQIENGKFSGAISTLDKYLLYARLELEVKVVENDYPQLDELREMFPDE